MSNNVNDILSQIAALNGSTPNNAQTVQPVQPEMPVPPVQQPVGNLNWGQIFAEAKNQIGGQLLQGTFKAQITKATWVNEPWQGVRYIFKIIDGQFVNAEVMANNVFVKKDGTVNSKSIGFFMDELSKKILKKDLLLKSQEELLAVLGFIQTNPTVVNITVTNDGKYNEVKIQ